MPSLPSCRLRHLVVVVFLAAAPVVAQEPVRPDAPEAATGFRAKAAPTARRHMVSASHPLAAAAGAEILAAGGTAVDAAVAVQMVLTLVEPQSSGIGGGAFLLHFDGERVSAYDGRETAPAAADADLFRHPDGRTMSFHEAIVGGRAVGVPGVLRMLELAHRKHGRLPWARLFDPAIALAERGFPVGERLHELLRRDAWLRRDAEAAAHFYRADGDPQPVGTLLRNPALAATLREIAGGGADAFYLGPTARAIVAKVAAHPLNPGPLGLADLAAYRPQERDPLCRDYRRWTVCGMPPPSSGGIAVAQILGLLEYTDIAAHPPRSGLPDPAAVHLQAEAARLAFADRNAFVADPDFVPWPRGLLDADYLRARAAMIGPDAGGEAWPGTPLAGIAGAPDRSPERPSTAHLSVVDGEGRAVAMTTSVEDAFGARQMVRGFMLNNQLSDFSFVAIANGRPVANRVEPGKRPRSSMAPTLVFERRDDGKRRLVMAIGSPGGPQIINYVARTLVATLDWGLDLQAAIALPNYGSRNGPLELEAGRFDEAALATFRGLGHEPRQIEMPSGLQGVERVPGGWRGGADPRRDGVAVGE